MAAGKKPKRTREERKQLTCGVCGAGNRLAPRVVEHGFQRCSHCRAAMPVEGAGCFAIEHRSALFTRVISPGRSQFRLQLGQTEHLPHFLLFLLGGDFVSTLWRKAWLRNTELTWLAWTPTVLFLLLALLWVLQWITQQRLLVTLNRIELSWVLFGLRLRYRRFGTHGLRFEIREGKYIHGVVMKPRGQRPILVRTEGKSESEKLLAELEEAIDETRVSTAAATLACPGCGAPVATPLEVIEEKGVECEHCGAGVVATEGGVVLGKVDMAIQVPEVGKRPIRRRRLPNATEWRLRPELLARPLTAICMFLSGLGCGGGMITMGVVIFWKTEELRSFGFIFAAILVPLGVGLLIWTSLAAFGSHRIRLDPGVLEHELRLLGVKLKHRVVPLARVTEVSCKTDNASSDWKIVTALRTTEMLLPLLNGEGALVTEELADELAGRLREMGRKVSLRLSRPESPARRTSKRS